MSADFEADPELRALVERATAWLVESRKEKRESRDGVEAFVEHMQTVRARKEGVLRRKRGRQEHDWERWDPVLGTMDDSDLSDISGIPQATLRKRRWVLGIEAHGGSPKQHDWSQLDEYVGRIGDDEDVGRIFDVPASTISHRRRELGRPTFNERLKQMRELAKKGSEEIQERGDGPYRQFMSSDVRDRYDEVSQHTTLSLAYAIRLIDTRVAELVANLTEGGSAERFSEIRTLVAQLRAAALAGKSERVRALMGQLEEAAEKGSHDQEAWREISALLEQKRRLHRDEWEMRSDMQKMISMEQFLGIMDKLISIIQAHSEPDQLEIIEAEFVEVLAEEDG